MAEAFGPVLPAIRRSYLLPKDATNIAVTLTVSESHAYPDAVTMARSEPICYSLGPLTGTFTATGLYPTSLLTHTVLTDVGGLRLDLTAIPLSHDLDTGAVTLYDRLDYRITYESGSSVSVTQLEVNAGGSVVAARSSVPVSLTLQVTSPLSGTLVWEIEDGAGNALVNDVASLSVDAGASDVTWTFDTQAWQLGKKHLWVAVRDEQGSVVASGSTTFDVIEGSLVYLPLVLRE